MIVWNPAVQAYELRGGGAVPRRMRSNLRLSGNVIRSRRAIGRRQGCPPFMLTRPVLPGGQGIYSLLTMPVSRYWVVLVFLIAQICMLVGVL